jgi:hypothetical protein
MRDGEMIPNGGEAGMAWNRRFYGYSPNLVVVQVHLRSCDDIRAAETLTIRGSSSIIFLISRATMIFRSKRCHRMRKTMTPGK